MNIIGLIVFFVCFALIGAATAKLLKKTGRKVEKMKAFVNKKVSFHGRIAVKLFVILLLVFWVYISNYQWPVMQGIIAGIVAGVVIYLFDD